MNLTSHTVIDLSHVPDVSGLDSRASSDSSLQQVSRFDFIEKDGQSHAITTDTETSEGPVQNDEDLHLPEKRPQGKRAFSKPVLSTHRRLISIMILINISLLGFALSRRWWHNLPALGYHVIGNITFSIMVRQQRVVNLLFRLATAPGTRLPLSVRWMLAKIYHFGGLHSGCSISGTVWMLLFTISATYLRVTRSPVAPSITLLVLTYCLDTLLVTMVVFALPKMRTKYHNRFEASHRFMGWTVLCLVWAHTAILIRDFKPADQSLTTAFFSSVTPYLLFLITMSIIIPWLHLRKVPVDVEKPSSHAIIVRFTGVGSAFPGSSSTISVSPLFEWHSFANIPKPGEEGFRLVISRAGDWTSKMIDNPPTHFWIKGIPTAGVASIGTLFKKVLYVCTGSGIGPIVPILLAREVPASLFWSTRTPEETYGIDFVKEVLTACSDSTVYDTTVSGKPDMVVETYKRVASTGAEAVICISNQKLTRKVVYGMEARGIPAFGAIWDS